jgi:putative DNA primase/helicase
VIEYGEEYTCQHGEVPGDCPKCPEALSDLGNARRLVARHHKRLRNVPLWRKWLIWDGQRWILDRTGEAPRAAKEIVRPIANRMRWSAKKAASEKEQAALLRAAMRLESVNSIRAMLELAATEIEVALAPEDLDGWPDLLNTASCTLDLTTFEVSPHDPNMHLTKVTSAHYDPTAEAPMFAAFLERIQPDADMREFLARLLGHTISGRVHEHLLAIAYGVGANGKSTLMELVREVLGDYAATTDPGLLIDRGDAHPTGIADLFGLRLALTHETDQGRRLAEGTVKRLTGGDRIRARRMREDFWEFDPTHSIVMVTNHRPVITGKDEGIWRRLRLVPFDEVIPPDERDPDLPAKLRTEAAGVLRWLVDGYRSYLERGLDEPAAVTEATERFRKDADHIGLFLAEKCVLIPHVSVGSTALFNAWVKWCSAENIDAGTQTAFSIEMVDKGYDKGKSHGSMVWKGIGLRSEDQEP